MKTAIAIVAILLTGIWFACIEWRIALSLVAIMWTAIILDDEINGTSDNRSDQHHPS
jgi:hypothetical protein